MRRLLLLLLPVLLAAGCGRERPAAPPPVRGALLVTVEGPIPVLGLTWLSRPEAQDKVSATAIRQVSAEVLPSAATALTGLLPPQHGLRVDGVGTLAPEVPTLATRFAERGWDCAAFLGNPALASVHGLDRGFSVYSAGIAPTNRAGGFLPAPEDLAAAALRHLEGLPPGRNAFVWLHFAPRPVPGTEAAPREGLAACFDALASAALVAARFSEDSTVAVLSLTPPPSAVPALPDREPMPLLAEKPLGRWCATRMPANRDIPAGISVADVPFLFGLADGPAPWDYAESLVPWYAFRLPPLERRSEECPVSVLDGLDADPVAVPLASQNAMAVMRANGHLGEGLVPPYTNGVALAALDEAGRARVERWRAAMSAPATNRVAALRALVASDPDVPLFHHELGEALLREKDFAGACTAFAAASRLGWNMVLANRLQARCHAAVGNIPDAIDRAEAAFLVNESDALPRRELAELLLRTGAALLSSGSPSEAKECLDRALLLAPGHPGAILEEARLELSAGQTNAAVARLRRLVREHPGDKAAQGLLRSLSKPGPTP